MVESAALSYLSVVYTLLVGQQEERLVCKNFSVIPSKFYFGR